ncbi:MAG TPA: hypothetical protein VNM92_06610 [Thermoanaerobaculia bacterium]|nr:hypothetical protein [Thermoanaerobaculia bacterium]
MSQEKYPTMVIPEGTEIRLNREGQLSIRTPGNLVIQNSGTYAELESTNGSIRIQEKVNIEAVTVRAAEGCFVEGALTAWRVVAKRIVLEGKARACIMIPDAGAIEVERTSRLVGNFGSEQEIRDVLKRFESKLYPSLESGTGQRSEEPSRFPASLSRK